MMDSVHKPQPFWRKRRAKAVSNRGPSAYQPNALPLGQTGFLTIVTVSKQTWCLTSTETIRLIRDGEGRGYGDVGRGKVYTYRYTVTTRMTCIKMGSDESYFNVSLIMRDKVTRPCPQTTTFEEKGEPKRYRTKVLPLTSLTPYR